VNNIHFKKISSILTHVAPKATTLQKQIKNGTTPNLPVDKDRYVDFVSQSGDYTKVSYPYLFRI
jgi:hypothetical protein